MRIGLYGGSFNPVHKGHVGLVRRALDDLALDRMIVLPAAVSPFKTGETPAAFDRLLLVRAAFNGMDRFSVDDREMKRGGVSYAIDTVREIASENPGAELFFIIGEDSLEGLPRWKEFDALRSLCTFKAYPRTSESSTEIRRLLASGKPIDGFVPESVALLLNAGVTYNEDLAATVLKGLERKGGYCPCRLPRLPEFFCPCREFREQLADPAYHGLCHCRLYRKP